MMRRDQGARDFEDGAGVRLPRGTRRRWKHHGMHPLDLWPLPVKTRPVKIIHSVATIPNFTPSGILPPYKGNDPTIRSSMTPFATSMREVVDRLGSSPTRLLFLKGLLHYRSALATIGIVNGFQWLDGSRTTATLTAWIWTLQIRFRWSIRRSTGLGCSLTSVTVFGRGCYESRSVHPLPMLP